MSTDSIKDCGICKNPVFPCEIPYLCAETGRREADRGTPHSLYHTTDCMQTWATTKYNGGHPVTCSFPGCNTDISHLLPKPGYLRQAADFFRTRPAVQILAFGIPPLAIEGAAVGAAVGAEAAEVAVRAVGAGAVGAVVVVAAEAAGAGAGVVAAVVAVGAGVGVVAAKVAAAEVAAAEVAGAMVVGAAAVGAAAVAMAVRAAVGAGPAPRNFLSAGAAVSILVAASTLISGGSLPLAVALSTLSALSTYWISRRAL